jgi:hypothetical protein
MLKPIPELRSLISLVPFSGIQFLDFGFNHETLPKVTRRFHEMQTPDGLGLVSLETDPETGDALDPTTRKPIAEEDTYACSFRDTIGIFLNKWVPLPVFRLLGLDAEGGEVFDSGPTNWARVYVTELSERDRQGNSHRVVVALDTNLVFRPRAENEPYLIPTAQDAETEQQFALARSTNDMYFFLGEAWVDEWLAATLREFRQARGRRASRGSDETPTPELEHAARYWTLIDVLAEQLKLPRLKLTDSVSSERNYTPIQVDLVLDVGNSRTCGILIESDPDDNDRLDLSKSFVLELRDLTQPEQIYAQPFESRVEFTRASFGRDDISRRSGRSNGFYWASFARVGPEAVRLRAQSQGIEGATGLSSPKRYLWDRRPLNQIWRLNGVDADGKREPPVSGPLMAFVTEEGDVIRQIRRASTSALRAKFSRSSLFTVMLAEIILQAQVMINSPATRGRRRHAEVPRELRRVTLTIPPAMPLAEQRILRSRAEGAIKLVWEALGWVDSRLPMPPEPKVQIRWDEATCTQLVYLYTEITQKFRGAAAEFFAILGKPRGGTEPSLRVASIDIGGGTTDLMVTSYTVEGRKAIVPNQLFREGFKVAGDDILEALVTLHVLPAIERHMTSSGVSQAVELVHGLVGPDRGNQSVQEQQLRRQLVTELAVPVALALMRAAEQAKPFSEEAPYVRPFGSFFAEGERHGQQAVAHLEALAAEHNGRDFKLDEVPIPVNVAAISATVAAALGDFLADLCEVVRALDCDVLLLSGRPSRLPVVHDFILSRLPVRPGRLVPMHQYRVGSWYPFRDLFGRIEDPKTTVAVGAMLAGVAESQIEGFSMLTSRLAIRSTVRYIGEMELENQIKNASLLFSDVDLDSKKKQDAGARVRFYSPVSIGFRQLPLERWPATPLYFLDFKDAESAQRMQRPLTAVLERSDPEAEDEAAKEDFIVTSVEDAEGATLRSSDVVLRLQTMKSAEGYWLDTGALSI